MPRITAQRQSDRRNAILDAGRSVLAAKGFDGASITDIARQAGISDGLLYRYFADKRALLMDVLAQFYVRVIDNLEAACASAVGFRARIRAIVATHIAVFVSDAALCRLFLTEVRVGTNYRETEIYVLNRRYTSVLLLVVTDGIAEGVVHADMDPRLLRDMLFGGIEHFAWRYIANPGDMNVEENAARISDILLNGFCSTTA